jgi:hypothetical protein
MANPMTRPTKPGTRGIASIRALLVHVPTTWRRLQDARIPALLEKARAEMTGWESGDEPIAHLQRAAVYLTLALELSLGHGAHNPAAELAPLSPEDLPAPHPNSRAKRRYTRAATTSEGASA